MPTTPPLTVAESRLILRGVYEELNNRYQTTMNSYKLRMVDDYATLREDLFADIGRAYAAYAKEGRLNWAEMQRYNRLREMKRSIDKTVTKGTIPIFKDLTLGLQDIVNEAYLGSGDALAEVTNANLLPPLSATEISKLLSKPWEGITLEERIGLRRTDIGNRLRGETVKGIIRGETYEEMVARLGTAVTKEYAKDKKTADDLAHQAANSAWLKSFEDTEEKDIVITKTWVTAGDERVRDAHQVLDGQTVLAEEMFEIPSGEHAGERAEGPGLFGAPELDYNCRCWLVGDVMPRTEFEKRMESRVPGAGEEVRGLYAVPFPGYEEKLPPEEEPREIIYVRDIRTHEEFENYVKAHYPDIKIELADITDLELKKEILHDFNRMSAEHPAFAHTLTRIGTYTDTSMFAGFAHYNIPRKYIEVNLVYYNDLPTFKLVYARDAKRNPDGTANYHAPGTTYTTVFMHEYGHHIENEFQSQASLTGYDYGSTGFGMVRDILNEVFKMYPQSVARDVIGRNSSRRSGPTGFSEYFAELYAAGRPDNTAEQSVRDFIPTKIIRYLVDNAVDGNAQWIDHLNITNAEKRELIRRINEVRAKLTLPPKYLTPKLSKRKTP